MEDGATTGGLTVKDGSIKPMEPVVMLLVTFSVDLASTLMAMKNTTHNKDFLPRMGLREEGKNRRKKGEERRMWKSLYVNKRDFFL